MPQKKVKIIVFRQAGNWQGTKLFLEVEAHRLSHNQVSFRGYRLTSKGA